MKKKLKKSHEDVCPFKADNSAGTTPALSQNYLFMKKEKQILMRPSPFKADGSAGSSHISGVRWLHPPLPLLRPAQGESFAAYNY